MQKLPFILFASILILMSGPLPAQHPHHGLSIEKLEPAPNDYRLLLQSNDAIRQNDLTNELILDLVEVAVTDSIIGNRHERHRFPGGRILRLLGWNWIAVNNRKEKFVGTAVKHVRIPKDEFLSEYDINWDLASRLGRYFRLAFDARQKQIAHDRRMKKISVDRPPFTYPASPEQANRYRLHCEWTPMDEYRASVDELFLPCIPGTRMESHPNFGERNVSIGLYGAYCSDCNHSCHPEIHPYEWIWWLNLHPDSTKAVHSKTWLLGLLVEGSNRFPKWSPAPRTGTIGIPFIFPVEGKVLHIHLEHLVHGAFNEEGFKELTDIPEHAEDLNWTSHTFEFEYPGLSGIRIQVTTNKPIDSEALRIWFDDLGFDPQEGLIYGRMRLATSVDALYTAKVMFEY